MISHDFDLESRVVTAQDVSGYLPEKQQRWLLLQFASDIPQFERYQRASRNKAAQVVYLDLRFGINLCLEVLLCAASEAALFR